MFLSRLSTILLILPLCACLPESSSQQSQTENQQFASHLVRIHDAHNSLTRSLLHLRYRKQRNYDRIASLTHLLISYRHTLNNYETAGVLTQNQDMLFLKQLYDEDFVVFTNRIEQFKAQNALLHNSANFIIDSAQTSNETLDQEFMSVLGQYALAYAYSPNNDSQALQQALVKLQQTPDQLELIANLQTLLNARQATDRLLDQLTDAEIHKVISDMRNIAINPV